MEISYSLRKSREKKRKYEKNKTVTSTCDFLDYSTLYFSFKLKIKK